MKKIEKMFDEAMKIVRERSSKYANGHDLRTVAAELVQAQARIEASENIAKEMKRIIEEVQRIRRTTH